MHATKIKYKTIEEYHSASPRKVKDMLTAIRKTIRQAVPDAEEIISYNMPAFKYYGILVYYAAHKEHVGFYPTASGIKTFQKEFTCYKYSKGAVQFPFDKTLPVMLIRRIVKYRAAENLDKYKLKQAKKSKD